MLCTWITAGWGLLTVYCGLLAYQSHIHKYILHSLLILILHTIAIEVLKHDHLNALVFIAWNRNADLLFNAEAHIQFVIHYRLKLLSFKRCIAEHRICILLAVKPSHIHAE